MTLNGEKARWKNTGSPDTGAKTESGKERWMKSGAEGDGDRQTERETC